MSFLACLLIKKAWKHYKPSNSEPPSLSISKNMSSLKEPEHVEGMSHSKSGPRSIQNESGTYCQEGSYQSSLSTCWKDSRANLEEFPVTKDGNIWVSKRKIANGLEHIVLKYKNSLWYLKSSVEVARKPVH